MKETYGRTLERANEIRVGGRTFYPAHEDALNMLPADMVRELARRHIEERAKAHHGTVSAADPV
jgi:hypothetical protein